MVPVGSGPPGRRGAPRIEVVDLDGAADAEGVVVVVDVLRAFTTACVALDRGAREIWPVAAVEEAIALRDRTPGALAMGEVDGIIADGFDLSNSPVDLRDADVGDRILVQRTSAGTQGIVRAAHADHLFAASFLCAAATAAAVGALQPDVVTMIVTGRDHRDGDEDVACAEYLAELVVGAAPDPAPYLARIARSSAGRQFLDDDQPELSTRDLALSEQLDLVHFSLPVERSDGWAGPEGQGGPRLRIRRG